MGLSKHSMVTYIQQRQPVDMAFINNIGKKQLRCVYNRLVIAEQREKQRKNKVKPRINNENKKNT